jgi:hypothetical protein
MTIERTKATAGKVKFVAFRPTQDLSGVEEVCTLACTQVEFVLLLQTGRIRDKKHRLRDLFKELGEFRP